MREAPLWRVTQGISQILVTLSSENQHLTSHLELLPWDSDLTLDPQPHLGDRCQAAVNMEICSPFCHVDQRWHRRGRFSRWKSGSNISSLSHLGEQMGKHVEELWASLKKKGGGGFFPKESCQGTFLLSCPESILGFQAFCKWCFSADEEMESGWGGRQSPERTPAVPGTPHDLWVPVHNSLSREAVFI